MDKQAATAKVIGAGLPKPPGAHMIPPFILEATYGFKGLLLTLGVFSSISVPFFFATLLFALCSTNAYSVPL